jgi:hypothetical protein
MQLTTDLVNRFFGAHASFNRRLTGGYTITTETGGKVVVLEKELQSVTGTAEDHTAAAALAQELWGECAGDPETPRKPCAVEHSLSEPVTHGTLAKAQVGGKAV